MGRQWPATYAQQAALMLVAGYYPARVVEKALRKTMLFWADFDNIPLPTPLREITVKEFARLFRRHLRARCEQEWDVSRCDANAAALAALREWGQEYRRLSELM